MNPVEITSDEQFEQEVLQEEGPVIVMLYFSTCPECQEAHQVIEEDKDGVFSRVKFLQKEVADKKSRPAWVGKVRSVPTFIVYKNGEEMERLTSSAEEKAVKKIKYWIKSNVK